MNIANLFANINTPLKKEELSRFTKENYLRLTNGENYEEIIESLNNNGLEVNNLYISDDQLFPFWYIDGYVYIGVHHLATYNDEGFFGWEQIKKQVVSNNERLKDLLKKGKYEDFFILVNERFSCDLFMSMIDEIPKDKVYKVFKNIYTLSDYGFNDLNRKYIENIFKLNPDNKFKSKLKTDDNGYVNIYRGMGDKSTSIDKAYSWTLNLSTAIYFASRFHNQSPIVYQAKVHIDNVVDYIQNRGESEILLIPEDLIEIKTFDFYQLSTIMDIDMEDVLTFYNYYKETIDKDWFKNPEGIHGVLHAKRVLLLSLILGKLEGFDTIDFDVLIFCSMYHDIGRINDDKDDEHGNKSIRKLSKEKDSILHLSKEDFNVAKFIIRNHALDDNIGEDNLKNEKNIINKERALELYRIFKDADNLDRVRFKGLDINYLRTETAKNLPLVAWQLLNGLK